jgi:polar amino acid transport system substrate-binding protein
MRSAVAAVLAMLLHAPASAACSRPVQAPAAPIGLSVIIKGATVGGAFPEFLAALGRKAGCAFTYPVVPRARLEAMFEGGQADIIMAAVQSEQRDRFGLFIPLVSSRVTLVSLESSRAPVASMAEVLNRRDIRLVLVRGYDYGFAYRSLVEALAAEGRVLLESDPVSVARALKAGIADATIMPPTALIGAVQGDPRVADIVARIRVEPLEELEWSKGGVYLSNRSLPPKDRELLERAFIDAGRQGLLYQAYQRYYPPKVLALSTRPLQ